MQTQFNQEINSLSHTGRFVIAFSGGMDSTALLHMAWAYKQTSTDAISLSAVHVNHQLSDQSDLWAEHCRSICKSLGIVCEILVVDIANKGRQSLEELARNARYHAIADYLQDSDCLLLAQHQDDQAETFLLQLMRGAGPAGLAAMPKSTRLSKVQVYRPLLGVSRQDLHCYIQEHDLSWVEDSSNQDLTFDRNFIRHVVRPELEHRWPAASSTISRAASHCAEQQKLCNVLAIQDLDECRMASDALSISRLVNFEHARIRNLLRFWVARTGLRNPSAVILERVLDEVIFGRHDARAEVIWADGQFRRYRDSLFILNTQLFDASETVLQWDGTDSLLLPGVGGVLSAKLLTGSGLSLAALRETGAKVHFRRGGEKFRPFINGARRSLKNVFQELGVPPWERNRTPLISIGPEVVAIGDFMLAEGYTATDREPGVGLVWERESLSSMLPQ